MKRIILLAAILIFYKIGLTQTGFFRFEGNFVSNDTLVYETNDLNESLSAKFDIMNRSNSDEYFKIRRVKLNSTIEESSCTDLLELSTFGFVPAFSDDWTSLGSGALVGQTGEGVMVRDYFNPLSSIAGELFMKYYLVHQPSNALVDSFYIQYKWVDSLVSIQADDDYVFDRTFSVYPNPANQGVNLDFSNFEVNSFLILDVSGRTVVSRKITSYNSVEQIDLTHFENGVYIVIADTRKMGRISKKIVVKH